MKRILILWSFISVVLADEETKTGCDPWPINLKSVHDCCNIPHHSNDLMQNICYTRCTLKSPDDRSVCAVECYVNMTGLIKDGMINKVVAKRIYEHNAFHETQWMILINDGVDKCEYYSNGSLTENLIKFYSCVDEFLSQNCPNFIQTNECDQVEEYFENCKNIQTNCTTWPRHQMNPEICCQTPQLFSENLYSKCRNECNKKEFLLMKKIECMNNCTYIESGLRNGGKVDFEVVKKMLKESSGNKSEIWEKSIETASQSCEKTISGKLILEQV